jgi:hypothetical protein
VDRVDEHHQPGHAQEVAVISSDVVDELEAWSESTQNSTSRRCSIRGTLPATLFAIFQ